MEEKPEALEKLLTSVSSKSNRGWKSAALSVIGAYLFVMAGISVFQGQINQTVFFEIFIAACSLWVVKFEKDIYVTPEGFVKDTKTWISGRREVFAWGDIEDAAITSRGDKIMLLISSGGMSGWKIYFQASDIWTLKGLFKKYAPSIKLYEMSAKR